MSTESSDFSQDPHRVRETQDTELEELVMSAPKFAGPVEVCRNPFNIYLILNSHMMQEYESESDVNGVVWFLSRPSSCS